MLLPDLLNGRFQHETEKYPQSYMNFTIKIRNRNRKINNKPPLTKHANQHLVFQISREVKSNGTREKNKVAPLP